jgi:F0F1-type ATP synthase membrane subunit a
VPIEFISYISKPISLGVRLFIYFNGWRHCLLKVIVGFLFKNDVMVKDAILPAFHILPLIILILLVGLELGVAFY